MIKYSMDYKFRKENLCDAVDLRLTYFSHISRRSAKRSAKEHKAIVKRIKRAQKMCLLPDCHLNLVL